MASRWRHPGAAHGSPDLGMETRMRAPPRRPISPAPRARRELARHLWRQCGSGGLLTGPQGQVNLDADRRMLMREWLKKWCLANQYLDVVQSVPRTGVVRYAVHV